MKNTKIQWTDRTWNPVRGCSRVSEGCRNCYAERQAARFSDPGQYAHGFVTRTVSGPRWTGKVELVASKLYEPLGWRKPSRVFVNSMSDLFHESLPDAAIDRVFAVMALAPQHTFQVLTKRPGRMREYLSHVKARLGCSPHDDDAQTSIEIGALPVPNVWLGVSVEDQKAADERIPLLLDTPAAIRFASVEPLLGPIRPSSVVWWRDRANHRVSEAIDWVIVGGESGPDARSCDLAWIRPIVQECLAASVPVFVKQLGAHPISELAQLVPFGATLTDRKGGDMDEWPLDLRVREFPQQVFA